MSGKDDRLFEDTNQQAQQAEKADHLLNPPPTPADPAEGSE
ncbi:MULTISPECIES: hypothetical protein [unclassified Crossiella]|nr:MULTISPECIES: hypothetical protein [unclassified Crossiella]